ncbi:MAG: ABC transporter ATP-binding protein [Candidatus Heimdallarchaeota archaeon]|nr:MAG: ABC transporter ATP-binding protein [Candidatus Heimdallarchaeota archaeon]
MFDIVKKFPGIVANDHINLEIKEGEIHALLGENGAGKTTLMNILYGLYGPDEEGGRILINGEEVSINEPIDAMNNGIGMVHQHFMLVPIMSVAENIILGSEPSISGIRLDNNEMRKKVLEISIENNLEIDPDAIIETIPVGIQQRVEILKILYRGANILILDEPTAVLTPQEVAALFKTLRGLQQQGKTIIIITHKLKEPMALADRITVLRKGKVIGTVNREETSPEELAEMMIGRKLLKMRKEEIPVEENLLRIHNLCVEDDRGQIAVNGVTLDINAGEIVGLAGVVGNGQGELAEAITGLRPIISGTVELLGRRINDLNTRRIYDYGIAYIPEDRQKTGSVRDFVISENLILGLHHKKRWYRKGLFSFFMNFSKINSVTKKLVNQFDIRTPSIFTKLGSLSGGNQQKVIVARELSKDPSVVIAAQPTRGLDVGVIEYVHTRLLELRKEGKGILLISSDLDEILTLSDRIAVIYEGEIVAFENPQTTNEKRLGLLMAGHTDI